jgi:hypothetical protein
MQIFNERAKNRRFFRQHQLGKFFNRISGQAIEVLGLGLGRSMGDDETWNDVALDKPG